MENEILNEIISDTANNSIPQYISIAIKLLVGFFEGLILGLERKIRQQAIGMRTVIIITVASSLVMIVSIYLGETHGTDPARIAAQVVSGIGFLGGGAIIKQGLNVRGLTSAATIWGASALGLATGAGLYIPSAITLAILMFTLTLLDRIEGKIFPTERTKMLSLTFNNESIDFTKLHELVEKNHFIIMSTDIDQKIEEHKIEIRFSVRTPDEMDTTELAKDLLTIGNLTELSLSFYAGK